MNTKFIRTSLSALALVPMVLLLAHSSTAQVYAQSGTPAATSEAAATGWKTYTDNMVSGKIIQPARASAVAPGCPVPPTKDKYVIGMAQTNKAEPWRTAMNDQLEAAVKDYPMFSLVITDAGADNAKQVANVENFLTQGVDVLLVSPNEAAPLTEVISKAYKSCIPVVLLDRNILNQDYTMFIGANNVAIGQAAGQYTAQWCKDNKLSPCNIAELRGLEGSPPAKDRGDGFRLGIADNPDAKIIASQSANWLREKAVPIATTMLQANDKVDVMYGHNDPMGEAAYIAAQSAGRDLSKILFVGIDGLPTPDGGIMSVLQKRLGLSVVYPTGARQAIDWIKRIVVDHITPPVWVELPFETISPDSAQAVCDKYGCPQAKAAVATATK
ncbi:MAG: substrate-binding domain-containing protein [Chloroflexota bacterium]